MQSERERERVAESRDRITRMVRKGASFNEREHTHTRQISRATKPNECTTIESLALFCIIPGQIIQAHLDPPQQQQHINSCNTRNNHVLPPLQAAKRIL